MIIEFATMLFQGRLTSDPEVRTLDSGTTMCKFDVAVNKRIGKGKEKTSYIPVTVFGKEAVNCGEYLSQGRSVHIMGDFETDKYETQEGQKRTGFGVIAQRVIFGSGGTKNADTDTKKTEMSSTEFAGLDSEQKRKIQEYLRNST